MLRQALINLVDNAIKYAPGGGSIRIRVSEAEDRATLDVSDNGPGVAIEAGSRVFDRFYRDGTERGAGLGLAIAKWAVEVNGGQLTLERSQPSGATFRMTLPLVRTRELVNS